MDCLVRNQDGDELLFVHEGAGEFFCDWGRLDYRDGDYIVIPRGGMWRIAPSAPTTLLLIECTEGTYTLPEKGIVGPHAIFDPAMLDVPAMDAAFRAQQTDDPWKVVVKRGGALSTIDYPFNPLDAVGWHGDLCVVRLNVRDIRPLMSHRYHLPPSAHTTFVGRNFVVCTFVPRPIESDPGALKVPVLSQQRRLRRSDLLSSRRLLQPRQHQAGDGHVPSVRLHARSAPEGVRGRRDARTKGDRRVRGDDRRPLSAHRRAAAGRRRESQLRRLVEEPAGVEQGETVVAYEELIARASEVAVLFQSSDHCDAGLVGAAVLTESGAVYTGCSVDLRCGIGFCAEHSAVAEMLKHHEARIRAVVASTTTAPCCRRAGAAASSSTRSIPANLDTDVIVARDETMKLRDLLPHPWQPKHWPA